MNKWKDKESFLLSLDDLQIKAQLDYSKLIKLNSSKITFDIENNRNEEYLYLIKKEMSNELFEHMKFYHMYLDLYDILVILSTIKEINFFQKQTIDIDGHEFKRKVEQLKKNANKAYSFTKGDQKSEVALPIFPKVALKLMVRYFQKKKTKKNKIHEILYFFNMDKPPRETDEIRKFNKIIKDIEDDLLKQNKLFEINDIIDIVRDKIHDEIIYNPKKQYGYF